MNMIFFHGNSDSILRFAVKIDDAINECPRPCTRVSYDIKTDPFYDFDKSGLREMGCDETDGLIWLLFNPTWEYNQVAAFFLESSKFFSLWF